MPHTQEIKKSIVHPSILSNSLTTQNSARLHVAMTIRGCVSLATILQNPLPPLSVLFPDKIRWCKGSSSSANSYTSHRERQHWNRERCTTRKIILTRLVCGRKREGERTFHVLWLGWFSFYVCLSLWSWSMYLSATGNVPGGFNLW